MREKNEYISIALGHMKKRRKNRFSISVLKNCRHVNDKLIVYPLDKFILVLSGLNTCVTKKE
jgi:hypothetical protein